MKHTVWNVAIAALRALEEEAGDTDGFWPVLLESVQELDHGAPSVNHVLHNQHILALECAQLVSTKDLHLSR